MYIIVFFFFKPVIKYEAFYSTWLLQQANLQVHLPYKRLNDSTPISPKAHYAICKERKKEEKEKTL